jgi:hypothetical protein
MNTDSRKDLIFTIAWIILLISVVLCLNLPWTPVFRQLESDSSVYAYIGSTIAHGQVLYRDVWEQKPPVGLYLNALAIMLYGQNPWSIWWLNLLWIAISTALFFLIIKKMFGLPSSVIASGFFVVAVMIPGIFQGGNLMEIYGLLPQVLLIGVTFTFFQTRLNRWVVVAGIIACISFLTKQTTISLSISSMMAIGLISLLEREWKSLGYRILCFAIGLMGLFVVTLLYWKYLGALDQYLAGVFLYSLSYVGVGAPVLWSLKNTVLNVFPKLLISKLFYIAAFAVLPYLIKNINWFWQRINPKRPKSSQAEARIDPAEATMLAVILAMPMELAFTSLGGRNLGHYFVSLIPATATAISYIFREMILFLRSRQINFKASRTWSGIISVLLGLCSMYWLVIALVEELPSQSQLAGLPEIFSRKYEMGPLPKFILANTEPNDPVLVWQIHLFYNFITNRHPPQRVIFPGELFISSGGNTSGLTEFNDELEANPPKLIIVQKESSIGLPFVNVPVDQMCPQGACLPEMAAAMKSSDTLSELQRLRDYFLKNYVLDTQIYDWLIYKRLQ